MALLSTVAASAGASPPIPDSVTLEGYRVPNGGAVWSVKVNLARGCEGFESLQGTGCEALRALAREVAGSPPAPAASEAAPEDELLYRIGWTTAGKQAPPVPVAFESPRVCRVTKKAQVECEDRNLQPAQRLLLELRALKPGLTGNQE